MERIKGISDRGDFICDFVSALQTCADNFQNLYSPVNKGNGAVVHAFQKLFNKAPGEDVGAYCLVV